MGRLVDVVRKVSSSSWPPVIMVITVFIATAYVGFFANRVNRSEVLDYAQDHELSVGIEPINGRGQVYFDFRGKRVYITNDKVNHISPKSRGSHIVWMDEKNGQTQIVLYNLANESKLELSVVGKNSSPTQDRGRVAWEMENGGITSVMLFDGMNVKSISGRYTAIRPVLVGDVVLYAQKIDSRKDMWQAVQYIISTGQSTVVAEGTAAQTAWPRFVGDQIKTGLEGSAQYY